MDIKKIKQLIAILEGSNLDELEVTEKGSSVRLVKHRPMAPAQVVSPPQPSEQRAPLTEKPQTKPQDGHAIRSPMVGTYYGSPSPNAAAFVRPGDDIKEGDTICIIEAMKTMNKIKSDRSGRVKELPVADGTPVEYNQILCILE